MNDFTKEELSSIYKCIRLAEIDHGECAELDNLKFKIQAMINNYCDHKFIFNLNDSAVHCHKCKKVLNE
jgi:hypothetical protein